MRQVEFRDLEEYQQYLTEMEKSQATIEKYLRDLRTFYRYLGGERNITKEKVVAYKAWLKEHYKTSSAASMLTALNLYLKYKGWNECCVRGVKMQRQMFVLQRKELTRREYIKLVETARKKKKEQLALIIQTIGGTGIRISELPFVTVEAVRQGKTEVTCKGKIRQICLTKELRKQLLKYCKRRKIVAGPVFISRHGRPLDRSNIWDQMKKLSREAGVDQEKVFPHNLRHFFSRMYYEKRKDIFYLADILGHSNVNTTRIYTTTTGEHHRRILESLKLII